jgi:hypothetical protein
MNAAERLWRALETRDWDALRAQLHPHATIQWPHSGERLSVEEYVAAQQARPADRAVAVRRVAGGGELVAVEATVGEARCAGFYDLHGARIESATEYWVGDTG